MINPDKIKDMKNQLDRIESLIADELSIKKWLNIKDVCKLTTLSCSTIRREISKGHLKVSKKTGRLLFHTDDIRRWLDE